MPTKHKRRLRLVLNVPAQPQIDNDQISTSSEEVPPARMHIPSSASRISTPLTPKNAVLSTSTINIQRLSTINQTLAKIKERDNAQSLNGFVSSRTLSPSKQTHISAASSPVWQASPITETDPFNGEELDQADGIVDEQIWPTYEDGLERDTDLEEDISEKC